MRRLSAIAVALVLAAGLLSPTSATAGEIKIIRDKFGVPHVYAGNEADASYGVGYALAEDRLWQMHVFRLIAKGRLSDLLGPIVVDIDKEVRFFTYTEEERAARFKQWPADIQENLKAFVEGINAWIDEAKTDPSKVPFEFQEYGVPFPTLPDWTVDDSMALSDVLILAFGSGGGNELNHAGLLKSLIDEFGEKQGRTMFDDLVVTEDPDGPITLPDDYAYGSQPTAGRDAESEARRALEDDARLSLEDGGAAGRAPAPAPAAKGTAKQLSLIPNVEAPLNRLDELERGRKMLERVFHFGSNAQIAGPSLSESGNAVQTGGPQVGYLLPQWLADFGIHGGDFDATGMTFAGAGPAVLIGRGHGYAWTTTTGASDLTDTYVEKLNPDDDRQYQFNGQWEDMDCRTETYTFRGVPFDREEICRTRHGPVLAFDEDNNTAYSLRYAWFNREQQTVEGFFRYQEVSSVEDFATFANYLGSNHNMFYSDDQGNFGYWHPGNHPVRADGIDLRLPQDGTGGSEWQGVLPVQAVPHGVNLPEGWLSNWNNQPALGWERERGYTAVDNARDLEEVLDPAGPTLSDPFGGQVNPDGKLNFEDLSANLRYSAFKHHRDTFFREFVPADSVLETDLARKAAALVRDWDGFLTDRDDDGDYDSSGNTIVDRWVTTMRADAFEDDLGDLSSWGTESLLWHLLATKDALKQDYDWLNGTSPVDFAAASFEKAIKELAEEFENEDPSSWREEVALEHYQRLNADLFTDTATGNSGDSDFPGDVADHIEMDRGTYNHVIVYGDPPSGSGSLGDSGSEAGSVIPPGQSGFINIFGEESAHYEDQLELYVNWTYKPMPMSLDEAKAVGESEIVITRG
jgi:penicillin amidase